MPMNKKSDKYLKLLSEKYPAKEAVIREIINLSAILNLPKGTEHFMSDIHGEYEAFCHILNNCSGVIREKVMRYFGEEFTKEQCQELCTLIYYPREKMDMLKSAGKLTEEWYRENLNRLIELAKRMSSKYTRSKVRKAMPGDFSYIIDELLHVQKDEDDNQVLYHQKILDTIIEVESADGFIMSLAELIKRLAVDHLHIVGDIFDRGPYPHKIMELLINHHSLDIEWGNHDILWMGASIGSKICISGVITNSVRHNNLNILEDIYGINLRPLANYAEKTYDNALIWRPRHTKEEDYYSNYLVKQSAKIHKAISIIMYKLEGDFALKHPEYNMLHRRLLDKIDYQNKEILIDNTKYSLEDTNFPTIDKNNPYKLTKEEEIIINDLAKSFLNSEALQRHMKIFIDKGNMYKIENNNLLYHALVPLNEDGTLKRVNINGNILSGKRLFDYINLLVKKLYYNKGFNKEEDLDLMWYLWSGPDSPFFGKDKMTTMERVLIKDKTSHKEKRNYYYKYQDNKTVMENIMKDFGITNIENAHIINGHIPVEKINGETPIKAEGKVIVIDGGFSKAYQKTTGIAGYTLVSGSTGMRIIAHEPFTTVENAILNNEDIHSSVDLQESSKVRITIKDTDKGNELQKQIKLLEKLIYYYDNGIINENKEYKYVKVYSRK